MFRRITAVVICVVGIAGCTEAKHAITSEEVVNVLDDQDVADQYVDRLMKEIDQRPKDDPEIRPALRRLQAIREEYMDGVVSGARKEAASAYRRAVEGKSISALAKEAK